MAIRQEAEALPRRDTRPDLPPAGMQGQLLQGDVWALPWKLERGAGPDFHLLASFPLWLTTRAEVTLSAGHHTQRETLTESKVSG